MDRIFIRVPSQDLRLDLLTGAALELKGRRPVASFSQSDTLLMDVDDDERHRLLMLGAQVFSDVQFDVLPGFSGGEDGRRGAHESGPADSRLFPAGGAVAGNLREVVAQIGAPSAWENARGQGVTIAVVDTGIVQNLRELPMHRRSAVDLSDAFRGQIWADEVGHGSMCAAIAAGSSTTGAYDGVAPEARVLSARSNLRSVDLFRIYDNLLRSLDNGDLQGRVVATNSYGLYLCDSPGVMPKDHPFMNVIESAIAAGVFVCFAAGNNHYDDVCRYEPDQCGPNSIWGPNSHDMVVSVGTVNRALSNRDSLTPHANSSRGPGEWAKHHPKPDCVAPTYGIVPWGDRYEDMPWWGTSGACPQVAGLAALVLSVAPQASPAQVAATIRDTCTALPEGANCVGRGMINCEAAVHKAMWDLRIA
ncbi:S8 family peptidase [Ancylobacter amanitiformis]|uniref:Subtilisin family serine protease n=1 Tax=Ancylobacter amanitiformis TaxID=217069 RepID=A0ABU0LNP2_9HYPH|nr:S8/S53 family peptidase [Ancylobacter amanitiformis]MDQ0510302.1 subtilisin family serine protease [Ancylobacter amanitiformis]